MKIKTIFLALLYVPMAVAMEGDYSTAEYVEMAFAIRSKIFELKDEVNENRNGHLYLTLHDRLDPSKNQTRMGIFLECLHGLPVALHLPVGHWQLTHMSSVQGQHDALLLQSVLRTFDAVLHEKKSRFSKSELKKAGVDPETRIYALRHVAHRRLEKHAYKEQTEYISPELARSVWRHEATK